jgi:hypothetical protein
MPIRKSQYPVIHISVALTVLAGIATACGAAGGSNTEATHAAQTIARMITDVAFQNTSAPSPTPTSYAPPADAATATAGPSVTTGPTPTPTGIASVELSTRVPIQGRATYNGSTPTTDATSLLTRTIVSRCNAPFYLGPAAPVLENSEVKVDSTFTYTWVIRNIGTCTWYPSYYLYWHSGARMEAPAFIDIPEIIPPNQVLFLSVTLVAPSEPRSYYQRWYFRDPEYTQFGIGTNFDQPLMVRIQAVA